MSVQRVGRPRLQLQIPHRKHVEFEQSPSLNFIGCTLSPDLQPATPPTCPFKYGLQPPATTNVFRVAQYLYEQQLDSVGDIKIFKAFHCDTHEEYILKEMPIDKYREILAPYWRIGSHENINEIEEIILGENKAYVFFQKHYGDLHSYVRSKRKLKETEASHLFSQIVEAVCHCHENGVILRDMKLRKFVFKDPERTELRLDSLEDACLLSDDNDDTLADKHGCPAYVSPEILQSSHSYSGKAADIWSLGVMLYTMLIGRYPFHDVEPGALFSKIRRGDYRVPDTISTRAKCIVRNMLRQEPSERLSAEEILLHPWFKSGSRPSSKSDSKALDQAVPDVGCAEEEDDSLFV